MNNTGQIKLYFFLLVIYINFVLGDHIKLWKHDLNNSIVS